MIHRANVNPRAKLLGRNARSISGTGVIVMKSETALNPPTGVLPFEMFRSYSSITRTDPVPLSRVPSYDICETDKEIVFKIELPEVKSFGDASEATAEFKLGVLTVTVPKRQAKPV
jgi:HSP20 family molecular chaperone IbpA